MVVGMRLVYLLGLPEFACLPIKGSKTHSLFSFSRRHDERFLWSSSTIATTSQQPTPTTRRKKTGLDWIPMKAKVVNRSLGEPNWREWGKQEHEPRSCSLRSGDLLGMLYRAAVPIGGMLAGGRPPPRRPCSWKKVSSALQRLGEVMAATTYEQRGVSPDKPDVKRAVAEIDPGIFPGAFCKAIPDVLTGSPEHCMLLHADGAGTKSALAYVHFRRHGDPTVFRGIAQDSLVMNLDDLLCVGATGPYVISNTIGRNAKLVPSSVLQEIIGGYEALIGHLAQHGVEVFSCGGETADVGDLVRTVIVDTTIATRMLRGDFIDCSRVKPGHVIVGFASFGKATYEAADNSGIGTNGFTAARHEVLSSRFKVEYPESFAPEIADLAYLGSSDIDDMLPGTSATIGEALLSPTRTYAPVMVRVMPKYRRHISAVFHNSGGGLTKCLSFGNGVTYEKTNLFDVPPVFDFIRRQSHLPLRELVRVFNMGQRMELVCDPSVASEIVAVSQEYGIAAKVIGKVTKRNRGRGLLIAIEGEEVQFVQE